jgi:hypothetical protein
MKSLLTHTLILAGAALALPATAAAQPASCGRDVQYVGWAILAYAHAPAEGQEQVLGELLNGIRRAERDCG